MGANAGTQSSETGVSLPAVSPAGEDGGRGRLTLSSGVSEHGVGHHHDGPAQHVGQHEHMELLKTLVDRILRVIHPVAGGGGKKKRRAKHHRGIMGSDGFLDRWEGLMATG